MNREGALAGAAALACQRDAFSLPADARYLNCAYISPLPKAVEAAGIAGIRRKRAPAGLHTPDFFEESDRVRELFARLVGAPDPERIAIIPAVSYAVATAARNLPVGRGQNIVLLHEQFPGNVHAWCRKADTAGAEIRTVTPPPGPRRAPAWNERLLEAIDRDTAVVTVPEVHWIDGTVFDLTAVSARAREMGAALVVDATQSVGARPFDLNAVRPDALIVAGYKWLLGPYSIGAAYLGPRFDGGVPLEETWIGRVRSEDFRHLTDYESAYRPGAVRYDVGERSNFILVPMLAAALRLVLAWDPGRVEAYCRRLSEPLVREAAAMGFPVELDEGRAAHLFGLRMPEHCALPALEAELRRRKISVSLRGSAVRVSPHLYNDENDVGALIEALAAVTSS
ncbi:MAG: aminotransferase class V-fold PLP-dependent enzyme [Gammaproteobacteria bacterium]|nr:aminotransferase class V-fold PLP-dependent enzyme [Gammaproteobacteria bacterium]